MGVNGVLCIQWQRLFSFWSFCGTSQHPLALCAVSERWPRAGERACLDYIPLSAFSHLLEAQIHEHLFCLPVEELKCFHFSLTPFRTFLFYCPLQLFFSSSFTFNPIFTIPPLTLFFFFFNLPLLFLLCLPTFAFLCYIDSGVSYFYYATLRRVHRMCGSQLSLTFFFWPVSWNNSTERVHKNMKDWSMEHIPQHKAYSRWE